MIARNVATYMIVNGVKWGNGEKAFYPDEDQIAAALDSIKEAMVEYDDGAQYEVGPLLVAKRGDHLDVYVHFGDYNEDS